MQLTKYRKYAEDVLSGRIVAGKLIQLACRRYLDWMDGKEPDIVFYPDKADKPERFINKLKHHEGAQFVGKPFLLQPWQQWIVYNIFGFYYKSTGRRVIQNAYIQISRKNGKSSICSALALYGMIADGEYGAEVDIVAPSRDQANLCYEFSRRYLASIDRGKLFKSQRKRISFPAKNSKIQVMSPDAKFGDGFNSHIGVVDEFHALTTNALPDLITSSMGMRQNPIIIYITTAGFNLNSPCKRYRNMCVEILWGKKTDNSIFAAIYEMDPEDDWQDETKWIKAIPALGATVQTAYIRNQIVKAKNDPSQLVNILTKNLNQWVQSRSVWIPEHYLTPCLDTVNLEDFVGEITYGGVDLGATSDLTTFSICIPPNECRQKWPDKYIFKTWAYIPETAKKESDNGELYKLWERQGHMIVTPGNITDYDYILKTQLETNSLLMLEQIAYDAWQSQVWANTATEQGLSIIPYSQSIGHFSGPTKYLEMLIRSGKVIIDNNDVVKWSFGNVELKEDYNNNVKPTKSEGNRNNKIDPAISMIEALGAATEQLNYCYSTDDLPADK